jgi:hypothetical protein
MKMRWLLGLLLALTAVSLIGDVPPAQAQSGGVTIRLSLADDGAEADGDSSFPAVSDDGRYVVFHSWADNLTPDDTNGLPDIFLHEGTPMGRRLRRSGGRFVPGENGRRRSPSATHRPFRAASRPLKQINIPQDVSNICIFTGCLWPILCLRLD